MKLNSTDQAIFDRVKSISTEEWFINGQDCPHEVLEELEDSVIENSDLQELIYLTTSGPDSTDMHIESGELLSEMVYQGFTEEELYESNRQTFMELRAEFLQKF